MGTPLRPEPSSSLPLSLGAAYGALPLLCGKDTVSRTARFGKGHEQSPERMPSDMILITLGQWGNERDNGINGLLFDQSEM